MERGTMNPYLVDIYGSCVSRAVLLDGDMQAKGCADDGIKVNYYFDKHPVLSCITPVPNTDILNKKTIEKIEKLELYSKEDRTLRGLKQEFSYEFFNTDIFKKNPVAFSTVLFPLDLPIGIWLISMKRE